MTLGSSRSICNHKWIVVPRLMAIIFLCATATTITVSAFHGGSRITYAGYSATRISVRRWRQGQQRSEIFHNNEFTATTFSVLSLPSNKFASSSKTRAGHLFAGSPPVDGGSRDESNDDTTPSQATSNNSKFGDFVFGAKATFANGLFFKIQFISLIAYFGTMSIGNLSSRFLPAPVNRFTTTFLKLVYELSDALMARFVYATSLVPQIVLAAFLVSLFYALLYFLMTLERPRGYLMQKLETLKDMTNRGETPMMVTVLREFISVIQICLVSSLLEEVTYRLFLPNAIYNLFFLKQQQKESEAEQQGLSITKTRPRDNPTIVTICSALFAIAHLETATVIASTRGHLISQVNRKFVLTFLLAQRVLAPIFRERGLVASWGAHASFNTAAVVMYTSLDYFIEPFGKIFGASSL